MNIRNLVMILLTVGVASACTKREEKVDDYEKAGPPPAAPAPTPPPPEPARSALAIDQNANYTLVATGAAKCVQFAGRTTNEQALAEIAPCDKSTAQQFKLQSVPGNYWNFVSVLSGKCLDVQAVSSDDGTLVQQFSCNGGPNQQWIIADAAEGTLRVVARHSGKVLDVKDSATADGTNIVQMGWRAAPNEQFKLTPVGAEPAAKSETKAGAVATGGKAKKGTKAKAP